MITWITDWLGTCAMDRLPELSGGVAVVDVRDMVDKAGNTAGHVREKIREVLAKKEASGSVVVCCDYGMSRSNAVALGALCESQGIGASEALRIVLGKVPETDIKLDTLQAVYHAIGAGTHEHEPQRNILVTGSTGFIGSHLVQQLSTTTRVFTPSRADFDLATNPLLLHAYARDHGIGKIVHLANPRVFTHNSVVAESLTFLKNILDVIRARPAKLVFPSGWEVYSGHEGDLTATEQTPANPKGSYGESKWLCELLIEQHRRLYGIDCLILRSSPVYGPGARKPKFIYHFMDKARRNIGIQTHRYRNGDPGLDLLHISDFVGALELALQQDLSGTYHLGTGEVETTFSIAGQIIELLGSRSSVTRVPIDDTAANVRMDASKFQRDTGWRPKVAWRRGLEELVRGAPDHDR